MPPNERNEFARQMALVLAPVFVRHFLGQNEVYLRNYAVQNVGCTQDDLVRYETGDLLRMALENTRNCSVVLADAFADHYFLKDDSAQ